MDRGGIRSSNKSSKAPLIGKSTEPHRRRSPLQLYGDSRPRAQSVTKHLRRGRGSLPPFQAIGYTRPRAHSVNSRGGIRQGASREPLRCSRRPFRRVRDDLGSRECGVEIRAFRFQGGRPAATTAATGGKTCGHGGEQHQDAGGSDR